MKLRKLKVSRLKNPTVVKPPPPEEAGGGAKNSFPIKLYPFALIYWFHALSPLLTAAA